MEFHARYDGFYGAFIHDPLALAAAIDPVARDRPAGRTSTSTRPASWPTGQTIADWRGLTGKPANVDVAVAADAPDFLRRFVERVGGLAERRSNVAL